jgi:predicted unusual protein kinase regulating ubiquinone biosynthesis (AarF/ABC1/UbiB family)
MDRLALAARVAGAGLQFEAMRLTGAGDRPRFLAASAQRLGPTFVKLAQFASTRKDVLPLEYVAVFKALQSDVESDGPEDTLANFRERLPGDPYAFFDVFDPVPLASGSIAQVHRAVYNGRDVAVKIVKRGVERRVDRELSVLRAALALPLIGGEQRAYLGRLLEQYGGTLGREMDMCLEADTMMGVRRHLSRSDYDVVVPRPRCVRSRGVLVMDYVPSRDVTLPSRKPGAGDAASAALSGTIMEACLYQIFSGGPFNCDPHEGNMGVIGDNTLVLYDFGNAMELDSEFLGGMLDSLVAFQLRDRDRLVRTLLDRGFIRGASSSSSSATPEEIKALRGIVEQMFAYVKTMDIGSFDTEAFRGGSVRLSPDLYCVMRTILMTEGICKSMSADFSIERAIEGFIEKHAFELVLRRGANDITRHASSFDQP